MTPPHGPNRVLFEYRVASSGGGTVTDQMQHEVTGVRKLSTGDGNPAEAAYMMTLNRVNEDSSHREEQ